MPCESCNCQFTVFRRKRTCADCKRFYCSTCLSLQSVAKRTSAQLCQRCAIFSKRPLLHSDLHQLKPKDLIFYLQSKHISTTGCVEKDELIRLVLNHVDQTNDSSQHNTTASGSQNMRGGQADATGHAFDNLRQTCQNFFFNISENISDSLAAFDSKATAKTQQSNGSGNGDGKHRASCDSTATHVSDQPRVSRREIPTYASSQHNSASFTPPSTPNVTISINEQRTATQQLPPTATVATTTANSSQVHNSRSTIASNQSSSDGHKSSTSSSLSSPIVSMNSIASQGAVQLTGTAVDADHLNACSSVPRLSDCECSDDELFTNFTARNSLTTNINAEPSIRANLPQPPFTSGDNTATESKLEVRDVDETSHSSFEELGAIACSGNGVSDDSKATEDSAGSSNTEAWQLLDTQRVESTDGRGPAEANEITGESDLQITVMQTENGVPPPPRKKLFRRRSERQRSGTASDEDNSPTSTTAANARQSSSTTSDLEQRDDLRRRSGTCRRCGKNNIRRYVEKMRRHLENAQMSEADIKRELSEFLAYLELQTRSVDYTETETTMSPSLYEVNSVGTQLVSTPNASVMNNTSFQEYDDENDGIHVYGADAATTFPSGHDPRFVNLDAYDDIKDLEDLTVKQLKEVLMLHRVDYKGCCEKQELLERVERLWKNLKSAPAVDKLQTDELCKICMDAPIECVLLECGHMATCTNCGKVLSECPICRQYIVRVVRFFRA